MDFWATFWATMWGALAGAAVGASLSAFFASKAAKRQDEREQARFAEQQRASRELSEAQRDESRRLIEEERGRLYRTEMDVRFERIHEAASRYRGTTNPFGGDEWDEESVNAWAQYLDAIERATLFAHDEDYGVLVALRQFSNEPLRGNETRWGRVSIFIGIIGAWRRGEKDYEAVVNDLYRNSHDEPEDGWGKLQFTRAGKVLSPGDSLP